MGSRYLESFGTVARELHFTRAAEGSQIARPAPSLQIRKLERQLGRALFERNNHRVELEGNAGGTVERCDPPKGFSPGQGPLLEHVDRILADITAVEEEMHGWAGEPLAASVSRRRAG
ncbi:LysR family transcriptional regulator [Actinomadura rubrisoli]|uniref:LysR family transcriptional regulator n=2 Tax=Actinomadura rubrisoli TaxID=2530368 RepID=A0A4R5ADP0_9ACTN|nr:LysR family transcriptional regulator [Actinomadura rubrisoli]